MHHPTRIFVAPAQPRRPTPWYAPVFAPRSPAASTLPLETLQINWERLVAERQLALVAISAAEPDPRYRLIFDLMWTTGARIAPN